MLAALCYSGNFFGDEACNADAKLFVDHNGFAFGNEAAICIHIQRLPNHLLQLDDAPCGKLEYIRERQLAAAEFDREDQFDIRKEVVVAVASALNAFAAEIWERSWPDIDLSGFCCLAGQLRPGGSRRRRL